MNTLTNHPAAALQVAHQTVADRVADAEHRALARTARAERRAALRETTRLSARPTQHYQLPWWAFRFTHPAH